MTCVVLFIQSLVCVSCVALCKRLRIISYKDFDLDTAKKWFPISSFLVTLIYTGSKSLVSAFLSIVRSGSLTVPPQQYLSIPVYTIFKNLTIIIIVRNCLD